jgi:hypothetical protein
MPRQSKKAKLAQTERNIMQKLKHPFIMSIYYAFQTQSAPCVLSRLTHSSQSHRVCESVCVRPCLPVCLCVRVCVRVRACACACAHLCTRVPECPSASWCKHPLANVGARHV